MSESFYVVNIVLPLSLFRHRDGPSAPLHQYTSGPRSRMKNYSDILFISPLIFTGAENAKFGLDF